MDADSLIFSLVFKHLSLLPVFNLLELLRRKNLLLLLSLIESFLTWHLLLLHDDGFEFSDVEELGIAEAWWAVGFITVQASEAILVSSNNGLASQAFATCLVVLVWGNHPLSSLILRAASESINALLVLTQTETLFGSAKSHEIFSDVIHHVKMMHLQFLEEIVFHALVTCKLASVEVLAADLTLDHNFRAVSLNMQE